MPPVISVPVDVLEYLTPALLAAVVERLHVIVRPKSYLLAFFHSDDKLEAVLSLTLSPEMVEVRSVELPLVVMET